MTRRGCAALAAAGLALTACSGGDAVSQEPAPTVTVTATATVTATPTDGVERTDSTSEFVYVNFVRARTDEWDESARIDVIDLGYKLCEDGASIQSREELSAYFDSVPTIPSRDMLTAMSGAASLLCPDDLAYLSQMMAP